MTTITASLTDLFDPAVPLRTAADKHFSSSYRQRTDGEWADRDGFMEHIAHLRTMTSHISIELIDELIHGSSYADRHIVTLTKHNGHVVRQEVYLFGELDPDGRFNRIEETTLMLEGSEEDRGIGSATSSE